MRVFAENSVGLGFSWSVSYIKLIPTHEFICRGKKWPKCHFLTYIFLSWVGLTLQEFTVFITIFMGFFNPTEFGESQTL